MLISLRLCRYKESGPPESILTRVLTVARLSITLRLMTTSHAMLPNSTSIKVAPTSELLC
jgi:hypothetical protein